MAFALVGLVAIGALFITGRIPTRPPGHRQDATGAGAPIRRRDDAIAGGGLGKPASGAGDGRPAGADGGRSDRGPGDRDAGRPGQHGQQLQVDDLRQVVGERGQPQGQVDQRLLRHHPRPR